MSTEPKYVEYCFREYTRVDIYRELKRYYDECNSIQPAAQASARTKCLNNIQAILQQEIEVLAEDQ